MNALSSETVTVPRTSQNLVAWVRRRPDAVDRPSTVHRETAPGSGELLCGYGVPGPDRPEEVIRGADAIDAADPFWPSCRTCEDLARAES